MKLLKLFLRRGSIRENGKIVAQTIHYTVEQKQDRQAPADKEHIFPTPGELPRKPYRLSAENMYFR